MRTLLHQLVHQLVYQTDFHANCEIAIALSVWVSAILTLIELNNIFII
ncbi:MAG: hypothetical protein HC849_15515 [Oscillatoriales cyanobacterium RU_3_3]|nr:hypothetical protein [Oscillatoriales cyanobacterium RU_3_3]